MVWCGAVWCGVVLRCAPPWASCSCRCAPVSYATTGPRWFGRMTGCARPRASLCTSAVYGLVDTGAPLGTLS